MNPYVYWILAVHLQLRWHSDLFLYFMYLSLFVLMTILGACKHLPSIAQLVGRTAGGQPQASLTPETLT